MAACENCERLQARIEELEQELADAYGGMASREEAANVRAARMARELAEARQAREDADHAEMRRANALKDLKRARSFGDSWSEEKALQKLERGW